MHVKGINIYNRKNNNKYNVDKYNKIIDQKDEKKYNFML